MSETLYRVENVSKEFPILGGVLRRRLGAVQAVTDVSFELRRGETLGLVGESGCGKSTLGKVMLRLLEPTSGRLEFRGQDLRGLGAEALRKMRRHMQMVFQDPYAALNPRMNVEQILAEPIDIHRLAKSAAAKRDRIVELLEQCGLRADQLKKFPHEFSGGQRQRICIARALAVEPELLICDEPVSALDVSIQAQILTLLKDLQKRLGLTYLFISHDLRVVEHVSTRVAVMYLGRIVEMGATEDVFRAPQHPYTQALWSSIPSLEVGAQHAAPPLGGDLPSPVSPPSGCAFHPRCSRVQPTRCAEAIPRLEVKSDNASQQRVACHYPLGM